MQSIEEFFRDYLSSQIAGLRRELEGRAAFRQKFYTTDCVIGNGAGTIEMLESETILSSSMNAREGMVVTVSKNPLLPTGYSTKQRYHLQQICDKWLIQDVVLACHLCNGEKGHTECLACNGEGWMLDPGLSHLPRQSDSPEPPPQRRF
jgi:hypothetical protein